MAPLDLTHVQFVLLACTWWLDRENDSPTQVRLAEQAGTDVKMTSQVVRALEAKGLVERTADPHDSRARRISPTSRGRRLAPRAIAVVEAVDAAFFAPVPRGRAVDVLQRLAQSAQA